MLLVDRKLLYFRTYITAIKPVQEQWFIPKADLSLKDKTSPYSATIQSYVNELPSSAVSQCGLRSHVVIYLQQYCKAID